MHRTQIYLPEDSYLALREASRRQRVTLAELIRRAVDRYLTEDHPQALSQALKVSFGAWADRPESSEELVRSMRQEWAERELRHRHQFTD